MKRAIFLLLLICTQFGAISQEKKYFPNWESLEQHKVVPDWFANAKLGIYFHWGVYSVPAKLGEWYPRIMYVYDADSTKKSWHWGNEFHKKTYGESFHYHDFIPMWEAPNFNAAEWVDMFEDMGARIIGSIAEHHDGFSMWDSKVNEWNAAAMGPKIDVVKAIAEETKKRNLKFMTTFHHGFHGLFYPKEENSVVRPIHELNKAYVNCIVPRGEKYKKLYGYYSYEEMNELWLDKLDEVIDAHCPDYIWLDFGQKFIQEDYRQQFLANYFNKAEELNKEVAVNTKGTFFPTSVAMVNVERATMDSIQDEVWVTDFILGSRWSYNKDYRTAIDPQYAIRLLADVVSKNGVMLLSAGPMADGTMPEEQVASMKGIGAWMKQYGEAIYDTRPFDVYGEGPTHFKREKDDGSVMTGMDKLNADDVRFTQKENIVYAIQLGWNEDGAVKNLVSFNRNGYKRKSEMEANG